jgi:outer membrane receptor for ferrienterochelin and colicin
MRSSGLIVLFSLWLCAGLTAQELLDQRLDFVINKQNLSNTLLQLSLESNIPISFSESFLPEGQYSFQFQQKTVKEILGTILSDTDIAYRVLNEGIVLYQKVPEPPARFTISGYVEDAQTGERLIAATVYDLNSGKGTITNDYGFFSFTLTEGPVALSFSFLGYQIENQYFELKQNQQLTISLNPSLTLAEVVVTARDSIPLNTRLETRGDDLPLEVFSAFPQLGGEGDILRYTHMMPGVQTAADGVGGIHIRGGNADQNLILLDGVPVYNATHAVGVFSIFNSSAVRSVRLHKGNFSARYAGRLSSILDVRTREGNQKSYSAELQAGLIGGRLTMQGPITKDKGGIFLAGRLSYLNFWLRPHTRRLKEDRNSNGNSDYDFYDINAKVNYAISKKDKLFLSLYKGGDDFFDESFNRDTFALKTNDIRYSDTLSQTLNWGNTIAALRWNRTWNSKLFSNLALTYSNYRFSSIDLSNLNDFELDSGTLLNRDISYQQYQSTIEDRAAKIDFEFFPGGKQEVYFGASLIRHKFQPGVLTSNDLNAVLQVDNDTIFQNTANVSYESGLYLEDVIRINQKWMLDIGVHLAGLKVDSVLYWSLQPRFSTLYSLSDKTKLQLSAGKMTQYLHLLTNSDFGLPTDLWVPSTTKVGPEHAWQISLGVEQQLGKVFDLSIETYYKRLENMLAFQTGSSLAYIDANNWEENVTEGKGRAYGVEWQLRKTRGQTRLWLNYTLAWAERQFETINEGRVYPFKFDRRHDVKLILSHRFNDKLEFTANWLYGSGLAFTLATSAFEFVQAPDFISYNFTQVGEKNALRLPAYHRLDVGLNWYHQKDWGSMNWHFGVYNLYNQDNPLYYRLGRDPDDFFKRQFVQVTILPVFPTISLTLKVE